MVAAWSLTLVFLLGYERLLLIWLMRQHRKVFIIKFRAFTPFYGPHKVTRRLCPQQFLIMPLTFALVICFRETYSCQWTLQGMPCCRNREWYLRRVSHFNWCQPVIHVTRFWVDITLWPFIYFRQVHLYLLFNIKLIVLKYTMGNWELKIYQTCWPL